MTGARQRVAGRWLAFAVSIITVVRSASAEDSKSPSPPGGTLSPQEQAPTWLSWQPPPECPGADFIVGRVRDWLGGTLPKAGDLLARGDVRWTGEQWEISVVLVMGDTKGARQVRVATCADAAEFFAVAIVLAVDPSRVSELPTVETTPAAAVETSPAPSSDEVAPAQVVPPPPPTGASTVESERHSPPKRAWFLGAALEGALGPLPSFQVGPLIEGGFERGPVLLSVGAHLLPSVSQSPAGAVGDISYALAAGRVGACYLGRLGPFELGPCAELDVGALWTNQAAPGDASEVVPWVDLQMGVLARVFGPRASFVLGTRLSVPLTQPEFVVSSGTVVHQPSVGVVFDVGVQFFFGRE